MDREAQGGAHLEEALQTGGRHPVDLVDLVSGDLALAASWDLGELNTNYCT
jgi:hypothetical protein